MKYKKIIIICIIGALLIVGGVVTNIIIGINKEKKQTEETMNLILERYKIFVTNVENYSKAKKALDTNLFENLYSDNVTSSYNGWVTILDEYTIVAEKVIEDQTFITENCMDRIYSRRDVTNACESFKLNLEGTINYYVKDVTKFNTFITSYNDSLKDSTKEKAIYTLNYTYTDINEDRSYVGKTD